MLKTLGMKRVAKSVFVLLFVAMLPMHSSSAATLSSFGSTVTTSGTWTNSSFITDNSTSTEATATSTTNNQVFTIDISGYGFESLPAGTVINSAKVTIYQRVTNVDHWAAPEVIVFSGSTKLFSGSGKIGLGEQTSLTAQEESFSATLAQLKTDFKVNFSIKKSGTTSGTAYLAAMVVTVDYTSPDTTAPVINCPDTDCGSSFGIDVDESFDYSEFPISLFDFGATDTDPSITWSISDTHSGTFSISRTSGELVLEKSLNFESVRSYDFSVSAKDLANNSDTVQITINVINREDEIAPVISGQGEIGIEENSSETLVLERYQANENPVTWSLSGVDSSKFNIDSEGNLRLNVASDFETQPSYSVNVVAEDVSGNRSSLPVVVDVFNDSAPPTILCGETDCTDSLTLEVPSNQLSSNLFQFTADEDIYQWDLTACTGDGGSDPCFEAEADFNEFEISSLGILTFKPCSGPGGETSCRTVGDTWEFNLQAQDVDGNSDTIDIRVVVVDADTTAPEIDGPTEIEVNVGDANKELAEYSANDENWVCCGLSGLSWSLSGDYSSYFSLESGSWASTLVLVNEVGSELAGQALELVITVSDASGNVHSMGVVVRVEGSDSPGDGGDDLKESLKEPITPDQKFTEFFKDMRLDLENQILSGGLQGLTNKEALLYMGLMGVHSGNLEGFALAALQYFGSKPVSMAELELFAKKQHLLNKLLDISNLNVRTYPADLVAANLIPQDFAKKTRLLLRLRQIPIEERDTVQELEAVVKKLVSA